MTISSLPQSIGDLDGRLNLKSSSKALQSGMIFADPNWVANDLNECVGILTPNTRATALLSFAKSSLDIPRYDKALSVSKSSCFLRKI